MFTEQPVLGYYGKMKLSEAYLLLETRSSKNCCHAGHYSFQMTGFGQVRFDCITQCLQ